MISNNAPLRDAASWIENASVEWKESEALFHSVARLTLLRGASGSWMRSP